MFIGHFALGFGAEKAAPGVSLGTLFLACQFADLLCPVLVLSGNETVEVQPGNTVVTPLAFTHYPYFKSLVALLGWGLLVGLAYLAFHKFLGNRVRACLAVGALVFSHWVLDFLSHGPDLTITLAGSTRLGLGLWKTLPATVAVEGLLFITGVALYARATEALDRTGRIALWALVVFLALVNVANLLGPPPPSGQAVAWTALSMWLLVAWGFWVDRHRRVRG